MGDARRLTSRWVGATLKDDSTLMALGTPALSAGSRVYPRRIPQSEHRLPALVHQQQSDGRVLRVVGPATIWVDVLWVVKLIWTEETSPDVVASILARVDSLLDIKSATPSGGSIFSCAKESELTEYDENDAGGTIYTHSPTLFRIRAKAS